MAPHASPPSDTSVERQALWPTSQKLIVGLLVVIASLIGVIWQTNRTDMAGLRADLQAYQRANSDTLTQTRLDLRELATTVKAHARTLERRHETQSDLWAALSRLESRLPR